MDDSQYHDKMVALAELVDENEQTIWNGLGQYAELLSTAGMHAAAKDVQALKYAIRALVNVNG